MPRGRAGEGPKCVHEIAHADIPVDPGEAGLEVGVTARLQSAESSREDRT